jgi:hypothetical protein
MAPLPATLAVRIDAGVTINVPVGKGSQPVRWIGTTAAELARNSAPRGALLTVLRSSVFEAGATMPLSLTIAVTGEEVGPKLTVRKLLEYMAEQGQDVLSGGVVCELQRRPSSSSSAALPSSTRSLPLWPQLAFSHSSTAVASAGALLDAHRAAARAAAIAAAEALTRGEATNADRLGKLLASSIDDPDVMENSFQADWSDIRIELLSSSSDVQGRLKRDLKRYYIGLCELYRHFSGSSARGSSVTMQKTELIHVLRSAEAMDMLKDRKTVEQCYDKARSGRVDSGRDDGIIQREFFEALMFFAAERFGKEPDIKTGGEAGPAQGFTFLLSHKLSKLLAKLNSGPVRAAMRAASVHAFLLPLLPRLLEVFDFYAALDAGMGDAHAQAVARAAQQRSHALKGGDVVAAASTKSTKSTSLLNLDEFVVLLEDAGLLDDASLMRTVDPGAAMRTGKASLTAAEVRETYSGVRRDEEDGLAGGGELSFGEMMEGLGRVAVAKWGDACGLKYVLDPRVNAKGTAAASSVGLTPTVFEQNEDTIVRALIMCVMSCVHGLQGHLGVAAPHVELDIAELLKGVATGKGDLVAAGRGLSGVGGAGAALLATGTTDASKDAATADPLGPGMAVLVKREQPRSPFKGALPAFAPARPKAPGVMRGRPPTGATGHVYGLSGGL